MPDRFTRWCDRPRAGRGRRAAATSTTDATVPAALVRDRRRGRPRAGRRLRPRARARGVAAARPATPRWRCCVGRRRRRRRRRRTTVARIEATARALLTAERTALNLLQRMSGIATATRAYVAAVARHRRRDPGHAQDRARPARAWTSSPSRCGGGTNHRADLADAILIKDNHVAVAGGVAAAVRAARAADPHLHVEVEADTLDQLDAALAAGADSVLLDNMSPADLRAAVAPHRRPGPARGFRRHHPRHRARDRRDRRRRDLDRRPHPLGARARHLAGGSPMRTLTERRHRRLQDAGARARGRAQRRHPRPQLPACPRCRTSPTSSATRSASPRQAAAHRRRRHRVLRRPLHGRDGGDPVAGQDRAASPTSTPAARWRRRSTPTRCARWKAEHPGAVVVSYVNTTAEVKAESDYCCTSGNAGEVDRGHPRRPRDPVPPRHVPGRPPRARHRPAR